MELGPAGHLYLMKLVIFLFLLLSQAVLGQHLTFKTIGVDVNDPYAFNGGGVELHFDGQYRMNGNVRAYRVTAKDTIEFFKGKTRDNYLYDTAWWYDTEGNLA